MPEPYEEILEGETYLRSSPGSRHEKICSFLHDKVAASLADLPGSRLLAPRSVIRLSAGTLVRPDLALVTTANHRLWLAAEIISSDDHHFDTVLKKSIYEGTGLPRLWMIDPRYDNVEIYHASQYGLALHKILAPRDSLSEALLPALRIGISDLFGNS